MGGEQIHRQPERAEEDQAIDADMPVVETDVDLNDVDALLDEIDSVLETNPEEFVAQYQQRGGE